VNGDLILSCRGIGSNKYLRIIKINLNLLIKLIDIVSHSREHTTDEVSRYKLCININVVTINIAFVLYFILYI